MTLGQSQAADETSYLVHLTPLWTKVLFDDLALEDLIANSNDSIGVGLPLDKPLQVGILALKILSFNEVYPQDTLESRADVSRSLVQMDSCVLAIRSARCTGREHRPLLVQQSGKHACKASDGGAKENPKQGRAVASGRDRSMTPEPSPGTGPRATYAPGA